MVGKDLEGAIFPIDFDSRSGEKLFVNACALVKESPGEINHVVVGGYRGTKLLIEALAKCKSRGEPLREELSRVLEKRRHRFLDLLSGEGVPFSIVRNERVVDFDTIRALQ